MPLVRFLLHEDPAVLPADSTSVFVADCAFLPPIGSTIQVPTTEQLSERAKQRARYRTDRSVWVVNQIVQELREPADDAKGAASEFTVEARVVLVPAPAGT